MRRRIVVGNCKVEGHIERDVGLLEEITRYWRGVHAAEVSILPPSPYLDFVARELEGTNVNIGAQDLSPNIDSMITGDISGASLREIGCRHVLVGHSDRRIAYGETYEAIARKYEAAIHHQLVPILCVGESLDERRDGRILDAVVRQLHAVVDYCGMSRLSRGIIAYKPAVPSGGSHDWGEVSEIHAFIREIFGPEGQQMRIIFGDNVTPLVANELFDQDEVDGVLIDIGASASRDFLEICRAADRTKGRESAWQI